MKKLILLLLVISATALTSQNYQYFTAKQGIPKAMEFAKAYFQSDSVCFLYRNEYVYLFLLRVGGEFIDSNGTSSSWIYVIGDSNMKCYFGISKIDSEFVLNPQISDCKNFKKKLSPIPIDSIFIDSDQLNEYMYNCKYGNIIDRIQDFILIVESEHNIDFNDEPVWEYEWGFDDDYDTQAYGYYLSAVTGECDIVVLDVSIKNNSNSSFNIKSDYSSDNVTIELNSDLIQDAELRLYDQVGVLFFADKLNNKSYELSTYNYPSGLYILQIKYSGDVITKTVMIVH